MQQIQEETAKEQFDAITKQRMDNAALRMKMEEFPRQLKEKDDIIMQTKARSKS